MKLDTTKFRRMNGYEEGNIEVIDPGTSAKVLDYKKNFLKQFIAISPQQIDDRLGDSRYFVTRKYDGEFATIVYEKGEAVTINRSGRTRRGIPCIDEAARLLKKAGVKEAIIPAEIYVDDTDKRTRTNDLLYALSKKGDVSRLHLVAFDILELNQESFRPNSYQETWQKLKEWFSGGKLVKEVELEFARSNNEVKEIYKRWVDEGTAEGLVVRSDLPFVFKVKPRHSVDGVIIGFTEGTGDQQGKVRTFLMAMMTDDNHYQVVTDVGGGMKEMLKRKMFDILSSKVIDSEFIDTDSNHVAFRMVRPDTIMEFSVRDVIYETPNGPILNPILLLDNDTYKLHTTVTGLSFIAPVFERFREDKNAANVVDTRLSQIEDFASFESEEIITTPSIELPESEVLKREVYRKQLGEKSMIQKYLIWKTNKEQSGEYPSYVLHYTNYSSGRQEPLQREVRISDSRKQIMELHKQLLEENIKKGWIKV